MLDPSPVLLNGRERQINPSAYPGGGQVLFVEIAPLYYNKPVIIAGPSFTACLGRNSFVPTLTAWRLCKIFNYRNYRDVTNRVLASTPSTPHLRILLPPSDS